MRQLDFFPPASAPAAAHGGSASEHARSSTAAQLALLPAGEGGEAGLEWQSDPGVPGVQASAPAAVSPRAPEAPAPAGDRSTWHAGDAARVASWLGARLGRQVHLTFTANRSTMLSYRERGGVVRIRLHEMFRGAGPREWTAVADYVGGKTRTAGRVLDDFVLANAPARPREPREAYRTAGRFHDLGPILDTLNATYFHGAVAAAITWGSSSTRRYRRTIQLGLYVREERLIRIHPSLDQAFVPRWYIAWIVFHEMLHDVFGVERDRGRRSVHPPEFSAVEQSYPDYARCRAWERDNLHRLLRFRAAR